MPSIDDIVLRRRLDTKRRAANASHCAPNNNASYLRPARTAAQRTFSGVVALVIVAAVVGTALTILGATYPTSAFTAAIDRAAFGSSSGPATLTIKPDRPLSDADRATLVAMSDHRARVSALNASLRSAALAGDADRVVLARDAWWRASNFQTSPSPVANASAAPGRRFLAHVATDKPTYRAGEMLFVRAVLLDAFDLRPLDDPSLWFRDAPSPSPSDTPPAAALWPANRSARPPCWPRWGNAPMSTLPKGVASNTATIELDTSTWPPTYVVSWPNVGSASSDGRVERKTTMQQAQSDSIDVNNQCNRGGCPEFELVVSASDGSVVHRSAVTPPTSYASVPSKFLGLEEEKEAKLSTEDVALAHLAAWRNSTRWMRLTQPPRHNLHSGRGGMRVPMPINPLPEPIRVSPDGLPPSPPPPPLPVPAVPLRDAWEVSSSNGGLVRMHSEPSPSEWMQQGGSHRRRQRRVVDDSWALRCVAAWNSKQLPVAKTRAPIASAGAGAWKIPKNFAGGDYVARVQRKLASRASSTLPALRVAYTAEEGGHGGGRRKRQRGAGRIYAPGPLSAADKLQKKKRDKALNDAAAIERAKPENCAQVVPMRVVVVGGERRFSVRSRAATAPALALAIRFARNGYSAGERVVAIVSATRSASGSAARGAILSWSATVGGVAMKPSDDSSGKAVKIGANGEARVSFTVPSSSGGESYADEGTLTVTVQDDADVGSITATLPLVASIIPHLAVLGESGDVLAGIAQRIYVEAQTRARLPLDFSANIAEHCELTPTKTKIVGTIVTVHEGRGRSSLWTPRAVCAYTLVVMRPAGIRDPIPIAVVSAPSAKDAGLRTARGPVPLILRAMEDTFAHSGDERRARLKFSLASNSPVETFAKLTISKRDLLVAATDTIKLEQDARVKDSDGHFTSWKPTQVSIALPTLTAESSTGLARDVAAASAAGGIFRVTAYSFVRESLSEGARRRKAAQPLDVCGRAVRAYSHAMGTASTSHLGCADEGDGAVAGADGLRWDVNHSAASGNDTRWGCRRIVTKECARVGMANGVSGSMVHGWWIPTAERLVYVEPARSLHIQLETFDVHDAGLTNPTHARAVELGLTAAAGAMHSEAQEVDSDSALKRSANAAGESESVTSPGARVTVRVRARDALSGEPVVGALIGLSVTDVSAVNAVDRRRLQPSLRSAALLEAEVASLEDATAFDDDIGFADGSPSLPALRLAIERIKTAANSNAMLGPLLLRAKSAAVKAHGDVAAASQLVARLALAERIDLLLATQAWRRFAFDAPRCFGAPTALGASLNRTLYDRVLGVNPQWKRFAERRVFTQSSFLPEMRAMKMMQRGGAPKMMAFGAGAPEMMMMDDAMMGGGGAVAEMAIAMPMMAAAELPRAVAARAMPLKAMMAANMPVLPQPVIGGAAPTPHLGEKMPKQKADDMRIPMMGGGARMAKRMAPDRRPAGIIGGFGGHQHSPVAFTRVYRHRIGFERELPTRAPTRPPSAPLEPNATASPTFPPTARPNKVPKKKRARVDFRETVLWAAALVTDAKGEASVTFSASDAVTTFVARADAWVGPAALAASLANAAAIGTDSRGEACGAEIGWCPTHSVCIDACAPTLVGELAGRKCTVTKCVCAAGYVGEGIAMKNGLNVPLDGSANASPARCVHKHGAVATGPGVLGFGLTEFVSRPPFYLKLRVPRVLSAGDEVLLPLTARYSSGETPQSTAGGDAQTSTGGADMTGSARTALLSARITLPSAEHRNVSTAATGVGDPGFVAGKVALARVASKGSVDLHAKKASSAPAGDLPTAAAQVRKGRQSARAHVALSISPDAAVWASERAAATASEVRLLAEQAAARGGRGDMFFGRGRSPSRKPSPKTMSAEEQKTAAIASTDAVEVSVDVDGTVSTESDSLRHSFLIAPRGFPVQVGSSGVITGSTQKTSSAETSAQFTFLLAAPEDMVDGSIAISVRAYPSPLGQIGDALKALLRDPCGCFEQTSSTTYPLAMALQYWSVHPAGIDASFLDDARAKLTKGYKKLAGFESKGGGFEWFGGAPAHEALTAYGVVQFAEIARALGPGVVDAALQRRTVAWLASRRDGSGGYLRNPRSLDTFGRASKATTNAYIIWSLSEADLIFAGMERAKATKLRGTPSTPYVAPDALLQEVEALRAEAEVGESSATGSDGATASSGDSYVEALAACACYNTGANAAGDRLVQTLLAKQDVSGRVPYPRGTITASGEIARDVETTALSLLAFLKAPSFVAHPSAEVGNAGNSPSADAALVAAARTAASWLNSQCSGSGSWGGTQATVLALKAVIAYDSATAQKKLRGSFSVAIDGRAGGYLSLPLFSDESVGSGSGSASAQGVPEAGGEHGTGGAGEGGGTGGASATVSWWSSVSDFIFGEHDDAGSVLQPKFNTGGASSSSSARAAGSRSSTHARDAVVVAPPFVRTDGTLVFPASAIGALLARNRERNPAPPSSSSGEAHTITLTLTLGAGQAPDGEVTTFALPWTASVTYRALKPPTTAVTFGKDTNGALSAQHCAVHLSATLSAARAVEGKAVDVKVQLRAHASASTNPAYASGIPMVVAVIGLPAGLEPRQQKLRELRASGTIAHYELHGNEVHFYWRGIANDAVLTFAFDTLAMTPGRFTAPVSRAWVYYTPELRHWVPRALELVIDPIGGESFETVFAETTENSPAFRPRDAQGVIISSAPTPKPKAAHAVFDWMRKS